MIPRLAAALILTLGMPTAGFPAPAGQAVFNVRDFGATGLKSGSAQAAIQKAVDACAAAGGGTVYVPPGAYSTGTIILRSHIRFFVEAGATIYSIKDKAAFPKDAPFLRRGPGRHHPRRPRHDRRPGRLRIQAQGQP